MDKKMIKAEKLIRIPVSDMEAVYVISPSGQVSFNLIPAGEKNVYFDMNGADPIVQISSTGDATSIGFAAGETRHNSALTMSMTYKDQKVEENEDGKTITTTVHSPEGITVDHIVVSHKGCRGVRVFTNVRNTSDEDIMIEALSSVNLSGLTPYTEVLNSIKMYRL